MMTNQRFYGKPNAGNPHVRLGEGEVASATPRRWSLLCKKVMVASLLLPLFCWAKPQISSASAVISGSSDSGTLNFSYSITDKKSGTDLDCRYVAFHVFESKSEARAWAEKIEENYDSKTCGIDEDWDWYLYDEDDVSNGKHTYTVYLTDEYGMTAREFMQEYPKAYFLAAVYDSCDETYSYKMAAVTFSVSAVSDEVKEIYGKSRTLTGLCSSDEIEYFGTISLTLGKVNAKTGVVKVSAAITPFSSSKKITASANLTPDDDGYICDTITFKTPVGESEIEICPEYYEDDNGREQIAFEFFGSSYETGYYFNSADIGGSIDADEMTFYAEMDDEPDFGDCWEIIAEPEDVSIYVKNGTKWSFDKTPTLKYKRYSEDGDTWYELDGLDDESKPNVCGVKLSYTAKTGVFKGTYYLYATNESCVDGKPTLKKLKVSVSGVIIDGFGYGSAVAKLGAESYTWSVYIEPVEETCPWCDVYSVE